MNWRLELFATVRIFRSARLWSVLLACAAAPGCSSFTHRSEPAVHNVYGSATVLPPEIKRVAIMPVVAAEPSGAMLEGCETLNAVVRRELDKTEKFETLSM